MMAALRLLTCLIATTTALKAEIYLPHLQDGLVVSRLEGVEPSEPSELKVVDNVIELTRGNAKSLSSMYVEAIRAAAQDQAADTERISRLSTGVAPLSAIQGSVFTVPVVIGSTTYQLVLDTGSSDPWIAASNFACFDPPTGSAEPQSYCNFGPLYNPSQSSTFNAASNLNFNVTYADGETLTGGIGYESISVAGITVQGQEFGVVENAAWYGDGTSSGLIGFAYSSLTSAYPGTNPNADVKGHQMVYQNVFANMYGKGLTAPVFSLALSRSTTQGGGLLAIGGIPNIQHSPYFVSTPIQPVGVNSTSGQLVYQFYSIVIDGWAWSASQSAQFNVNGNQNRLKTNLVGNGTTVIVDSGTSLIYAPYNVVSGVAASFKPPATYSTDDQAWVVNCNAVAPLLGVSISKKIFYVNPADLFIQGGPYGQCWLGIQQNGGGLTILGDVWMKSVLAVFDIGASQMRFAAREFYDTPPCNGQSCPGTV